MIRHSAFVWQWCICFILFAICRAFLNIEELTNSKYALEILNNPMNEKDVGEQTGLRLASKHGQDYFCSLPSPSVKTVEKEEDKIPKSTPVGSLLEPLRTDECFKIMKGWWTYELCYGRYIIQYHMEGNGEKGDVTTLGVYEADFDWNKEALEETMNSKRHKMNRYHSQTYVNGTACDVLNHNRDTEVRYICDDSSLETYIERVDEPSTCSYIITVRTPYICSHPRTRPIQTPKPESITCQPLLSVNDFSEFQMVKAWRKQQAEIEALRQLEIEKMLLEKTMRGQINFKELLNLDFSEGQVSLGDLLQPIRSNTNLDASRKMVEMFVNIKDLQKLDSFQQKRLLMDVNDLIKLNKKLPTADQARIIQEYTTRFIKKPSQIRHHHFPPSMEKVDANSMEQPKPPLNKKPLKVHLKFQKLDLDKLSGVNEDDLISADDDSMVDPTWKKLEDEITQGLEDAGYQSDERHFEIRVISSKDSFADSIQLDSEEGERFRQMLVELVAGNTAMRKEVKKQKLLADNYNMVWKKDSATFTVLEGAKEDNDDVHGKQL